MPPRPPTPLPLPRRPHRGPGRGDHRPAGRPSRLRAGRLPESERGFILPLAFAASLLLLLGSLSLQTLALQARLSLLRRQANDLQDDALSSAAQQLVGALNLHHRCLLALPLQRWSSDGLPCASVPQQQAVLSGEEGPSRWHLVDWQPGPDRADLQIELQPLPADAPRRRGSFVVALLGEPLRAQAPRLLALRGVQP